ncbi:MAG: hypothetical protein JNM26_19855 [Ideonella sp.]|nr:hypothetical protein [Ideonella sp.]
MNATMGWGLAVLAVAVGWFSYGWQGVVLAVSVVVFWLLLQFSRALRVMRNAADMPLGSVPSVVMLQSRLKPGLTMMQVVGMTRSLGRRVDPLPAGADGADEAWHWSDEGGVGVVLLFGRGKLLRWTLERPPAAEDAAAAP